MKKTTGYFLILFFLLSSGCNQTPGEEFTIQRGTNISHWLSQSSRRNNEREAWFTKKDIDLIAQAGYDHIRLPVDEEHLWNESGEKQNEAFTLLHNAIGWAMDRDLRVVVDLHIIRSHHFNREVRPLWTDPAEQEKFVDLWRQLSAELNKYPTNRVAYELMNEAVTNDPANWNRLLARAHEAIRKLEPERKIVIGSNNWQSVYTFPDLAVPQNDPNIILSFHFYHPMVLTHYGASWTKVGEYDGPVNYPGKVVPDSSIARLEGELKNRVERWGGVYNIDSMRSEVQIPIEYASEHQLALYCGEWGCLPSVPEDARLAWYSDLRRVLEENDIAWAHWDYKGGFGIVDEDMNRDEELIRVLTGELNVNDHTSWEGGGR